VHKHNSGKGSYEARVEKDVLLANTDMINGMSGSPLFDHDGQVIGIGSTILKDKLPLDYDPKINAVYIKAEHIQDVLSGMK